MWKIVWQIVCIFSIAMSIIMFIRFTISGYKDIKKLLED
jgi:magnesium-transporting ATPase (P-type)